MDEVFIRNTPDGPGAYCTAIETAIVNARKVTRAHSKFGGLSGNYYRCRIGMAYTDNWTGGPNGVGPNPMLGFSENE